MPNTDKPRLTKPKIVFPDPSVEAVATAHLRSGGTKLFQAGFNFMNQGGQTPVPGGGAGAGLPTSAPTDTPGQPTAEER